MNRNEKEENCHVISQASRSLDHPDLVHFVSGDCIDMVEGLDSLLTSRKRSGGDLNVLDLSEN